MSTPPPRLELQGISKHFGHLRANDDISLRVMPGEVLCLLGENGAGKSTLMNVVYGLVRPDRGTILIDGEPVTIRSPHEAIAHGIGMVHQHFMLVPTFTVTENVILATRPLFSARRPSQALVGDLRRADAQVAAVAERYGLHVAPNALVSSLSVGEQQRAEIVKALYRGVNMLILDEPTAVLTPQEANDLFVTLRTFTDSGLAVILITHKLNEVMNVADRVTVLRDGKVVGERKRTETSIEELAGLMVGREVKLTTVHEPAKPGARVLELRGVTVKRHNRDGATRRATPRRDVIGVASHNALDNVTFHVAAGEIVGIAGVDGNGQSEVAATITGILQADSGEVLVDGKQISGRTPREIISAGVAAVPEDRQSQGLILDFSVADNFVTKSVSYKRFARGPMLRVRTIAAHARRLISRYDIRNATPGTRVGSLSGGNQQKVVLGREMDSNPRVLVAAQPSRGLDVGATEYVHRSLVAQRDAGAAILLISTELEEVLSLSDRILVMYEGRIVGEVPGDRANTQRIGLMMAGLNPETKLNPTAVANEAS